NRRVRDPRRARGRVDGAARRRPRRGAAAAAGGPEGSAAAQGRREGPPLAALLVLGQVGAERPAQVLGQLLVLLREVITVPADQGVVLEVQDQVPALDRAGAAGALRRRVVPALVVERVGDGR